MEAFRELSQCKIYLANAAKARTEKSVNCLLEERDVFAVMPTGY